MSDPDPRATTRETSEEVIEPGKCRFTDQCPRCKAVTFGHTKCPSDGTAVEPLPADPTERLERIEASLAMSRGPRWVNPA